MPLLFAPVYVPTYTSVAFDTGSLALALCLVIVRTIRQQRRPVARGTAVSLADCLNPLYFQSAGGHEMTRHVRQLCLVALTLAPGTALMGQSARSDTPAQYREVVTRRREHLTPAQQ